MKQLTRLAIVGATALLAMGCQRDNSISKVPNNPTYNPEKGEVTTQFVLNIAPGTTPKTKLGADVVQYQQPFRGITAAHILAFELDNDNKAGGEFYIYKPGDEQAKATRDYDLGDLVAENGITDDQSSRVLELSLPLKTNALAFYGLASKPSQGTMTNIAYNNKYGKVVADGTGFGATVDDISFSLVNRLTDRDAFSRFGALLSGIMTGIIRTECAVSSENPSVDRSYAYWWPQDEVSATWKTRVGDIESGNPLPADDTDRLTHEADGYTYVVGTETWKRIGNLYKENPSHSGLSPLGEVLADAYVQLTTIRKDKNDETKVELRSGSAGSILKTLRDLNDVLSRVINAEHVTSQSEQVAKELAKEIRYRLKLFFSSDDNWKTINWKPISQIVEAAADNIPTYATMIAGTTFTQDYLPSNTTLTGGFPLNLGLPMSTALLTFVDQVGDSPIAPHFEYLDAVPAYGMDAESVPVSNYRFPPEIIYWANSGIRVNDLAKAKEEYPKTVNDWATPDNTKWIGWTPNGSVLSTTRSVAMMKQVNYGVALMQTNMSYANLNGTVAYDNKSGIFPTESDNAITITNDSFKVAGVFIGGVREKVGWDFTAVIDPVNNKPDKLIYDRFSESGQLIPLNGTTTFYTTTWDNYVPQLDNTGAYVGPGRQEDQQDVYIAVELINNTGKDLWGELNLIRAGGTFYVVGKLDLAAALVNNNVTFPDSKYCHYPPYKETDGSTIEVKRVFMQDYMTVANLHFTQSTLKHAYVTVPDLRSSQISLGLSVDLKWNDGLSFDLNLGEN